MKKQIIILLALIISISLMAQETLDISWQRSVGGSSDENARSVIRTADHSYFITGTTSSDDNHVNGNHGASDIWGVLMDETANFTQVTLGGSNYEQGYDAKQTSDGGYIILGSTNSNDGQVSGLHGETDIWVVKLNAGGSIEWKKCLGGSGYDAPSKILLTADGGYFIAGLTNSTDGDVSVNHGWADVWLVKLSENGTIEWEKSYGGTDFEDCLSCTLCSDNSYIIAAATSSHDGDVTGNHGSSDQWIIKVDQMGDMEWQKCIGGSGFDSPRDIIQASDGYYYVLGYAQSTDGDVNDAIGNTDFWLVKLDQLGNIIWTHSYGGTDYDDGHSLCEYNETIVMAGATNSVNGDVSLHIGGYDQWVVAVDQNGALLWEKSLGGSLGEAAFDIISTDPGLFIAGATRSNDGHVTENFGGRDFWLVKLEWSEGLEENKTQMAQVFPNPVKNGLLNINAVHPCTLEILTISGKIVYSCEIRGTEQTIQLNGINSGLYLARFVTPDDIQIKKILIE